jgi:hypothetical protein
MAWLIDSSVLGAAALLLAFSQSMIALVATIESAWYVACGVADGTGVECG